MTFDHSEFRAVFLAHRERLYRFLFRLTRNGTDAEDIMQDTFLTVWRKRDQFEGRGSLEGYLRRTAYRLFLNGRQRREQHGHLTMSAPSADGALGAATSVEPEGAFERREAVSFLIERVRRALDELPGPARDAFVLFRFEGLSCAQIAAATGAPTKTVETRIARATRSLAQRLRPYRHHLPAS